LNFELKDFGSHLERHLKWLLKSQVNVRVDLGLVMLESSVLARDVGWGDG